MKTIYYDDRPCGSGKSYTERLNIATTPGLYLYCVEKRDAMDEPIAAFTKFAADAGTSPTIIQIFAQRPILQPDGSMKTVGSSNVRVDIEALPSTYKRGHVIIIATHEGSKGADLSGFANWSLIFDETPSIWDKQTVSLTVGKDFLKEHYALETVDKNNGVSRIVSRTMMDVTDPKTGDIVSVPRKVRTAREIAKDDWLDGAAVLHSRVLSERIDVCTRTMHFDELDDDGEFVWWSIWSPEQLAVFDRVTILANAFTRSVSYRILSTKWPEIEWVKLDRPTTRPFADREVHIHYYARGHHAERDLWKQEIGQTYLRRAALDIESRIDPSRHIWMCSSKDTDTLTVDGWYILTGVKLTPRQQGQHKFAYANHISMLYTAKPDLTDRMVARLIGIDPDAITETREREVLVQFACRGSVRLNDSPETMHVYVYDEDQARHLHAYFASTHYVSPVLVYHDLGFGDWTKQRKKAGRKVVVLSAEEQAAKALTNREKGAERQRRKRERDRQMKAA